MRRITRLACGTVGVAALGAVAVEPARALVIASGVTGLENTSAPLGETAFADAFAHAGVTQLANGVYLGHGVVWAAAHQEVKDITFAGQNYFLETAPKLNLHAIGSLSTPADLVVKRITTTLPNLATLYIAPTTPTLDTQEIRMVSGGYVRQTALSTWGVDVITPTNWVWSAPNSAGPDRTEVGYRLIEPDGLAGRPPHVLRWGTNHVEQTNFNLTGAGRATMSFVTFFDSVGSGFSTPHEAQGAGWDSGGSIFVQSGAQYKLAGMLLAAGGIFPNQPSAITNAIFDGSATVAADLSKFRDQIVHFMVTPRDVTSSAITGSNVTVGLLPTSATAGDVTATFTSATNLVMNSEYQTVFADMVTEYFDTQARPFTSFSFGAAGATQQVWNLDPVSGSRTGPITLVFEYDPSMLSVSESSLAMFHWESGAWVSYGGVIDQLANTITITAPSLSPFALGVGITSIPEPVGLGAALLAVVGLSRRRRM